MRSIIFAFFLAIITSGSPQAEERSCTGAYRARVVLFFELVHTQVSIMIRYGAHYFCIGLDVFFSRSAQLLAGLEESQASRKAGREKFRELWDAHMRSAKSRCRSIQQTLSMKFKDPAIQLAFSLARVHNKHESRLTMRRQLSKEDFSIGKMAAALQAHVDRERLILTNTGDLLELPPGKLENIVNITAGSFGVCQAIRHRNPAHCANLESNRTDCELLAAKAILEKEACTEKVVRILSGLTGRKTADMKTYCEAIANQQPEKCRAIPDISEVEAAFCRALAGGGAAACRDPVFSEAASRDCLFELKIHQVLAGKIPLSAVPGEYKKQELVWPALLAATSDISCDELALRVYDEAVASFHLFTSIFR